MRSSTASDKVALRSAAESGANSVVCVWLLFCRIGTVSTQGSQKPRPVCVSTLATTNDVDAAEQSHPVRGGGGSCHSTCHGWPTAARVGRRPVALLSDSPQRAGCTSASGELAKTKRLPRYIVELALTEFKAVASGFNLIDARSRYTSLDFILVHLQCRGVPLDENRHYAKSIAGPGSR